MLSDARHDPLAFAGFPAKNWRQIGSTNWTERVDKEINHGADVFPSVAALLLLTGARLHEQHDESGSP